MDRGKEKITPDFMPGLSEDGSSSKKRKKKKETVFPLFPWLTDRRAVVHSKDYLLSKGITAITGEMECKICRGFLVFDLEEKFEEISLFLAVQSQDVENSSKKWMRPTLPSCPHCFSPVIARRK